MISREHILSEIRRLAGEKAGPPPGKRRFEAETGVKESDWSGRYWARWSDVLKEAGLSSGNVLQERHDDAFLLKSLAQLVKELGRFPVAAELQLKRRQDGRFPSDKPFRRFGDKAGLVKHLQAWCESDGTFPDVVSLCESASLSEAEEPQPVRGEEAFGSVYLSKSGKYYKIGRSNSVGRRQYELTIQLPEKLKLIHEIKTDDPAGIEAYWHRRFADRHKNGEWYELTKEDLAAFARRKFM